MKNLCLVLHGLSLSALNLLTLDLNTSKYLLNEAKQGLDGPKQLLNASKCLLNASKQVLDAPKRPLDGPKHLLNGSKYLLLIRVGRQNKHRLMHFHRTHKVHGIGGIIPQITAAVWIGLVSGGVID